ncbi:MAG TPA: hypothetical protein VK179_10770 [Bacteroidales bacterium]|nr:hypothetical protein [Bacteroidales bacterium]
MLRYEKKIDFNSLPQAIADLYEKVENIEKLIIKLSEKLEQWVKKQDEKPARMRKKGQYPITEEKVTLITEPSIDSIDVDALTVEQASLP